MAACWWWKEWQLVSGGESGSLLVAERVYGSLLVVERVAACWWWREWQLGGGGGGGGESGSLVVVERVAACWWWREWQLVGGGESSSLLVVESVMIILSLIYVITVLSCLIIHVLIR